jgi:fructosamine-3-kinase
LLIAMPDFTAVAPIIAAARGQSFQIESCRSVGGGSIHSAWEISGAGQQFFLKCNETVALPMFQAEADGLAALDATGVIRVPQVVACGLTPGYAYLVLEHLDLQCLNQVAGTTLGQALGALHRASKSGFGWERDNFIGSTPQFNTALDNWPRFFAERRLRPQFSLAAERGMDRALLDLGATLADRIGGFFCSFQPQPSLLHGDLWSGNVAALPGGIPVIYDPAVYRGDREADLAMAELFGGFPDTFYAAYREAWPLDAGYETRKNLYNLYHILNHFNLFGAAYLGQAKRMVERLLSELKG